MLFATNFMRHIRMVLIVISTLFLHQFALAQTILHVDGDNGLAVPNTPNPGGSWNNAFKYLPDAIALAEQNANGLNQYQIWVAATILSNPYRPDRNAANPGGSGDDGLSFEMASAVQVYGGFEGGELALDDRDIIAFETILSGEIADPGIADNSGHVVAFDSLTGSPAVIDGFTISDGNGDNASNLSGFGGGIFVSYSSNLSIIRNCAIKNNTGTYGGGMAVFATNSGSIVEIRSCNFQGNDSSSWGGGLNMETILGEINIITTLFVDNNAYEGGAINGYQCELENLKLINCDFIDNSAVEGGAIHTEEDSGALLVNCLLHGNNASIHGGAIDHGGSAIDEVSLINCTLADNSSPQGSFYLHGGALATVVNSILWNSSDDEFFFGPFGGTTDVTYSDVKGDPVWAGTGNINVDPEFINAAMGNYRLAFGSPCIEKGNNSAVPCDEFDVDQDGFNCSNSAQPTPDLDLLDRIVNGLVDMGGYEYPDLPCPWDLDGNGVVGTSDLLELFAQWGTAGPADFNNDGIVNTEDLLILFANWGPCPASGLPDPLTVEEELIDACLTMDNWNEYVGVMMGSANQATKDRYKCWMEHYINDCNRCTCLGPVPCPNPDPFDD
ncbi:MAG: hypothetical protein IH984_01570 [Planctomycetes bacterium]|nr:hypothetical protein [Planctomycetota bacterium]